MPRHAHEDALSEAEFKWSHEPPEAA